MSKEAEYTTEELRLSERVKAMVAKHRKRDAAPEMFEALENAEALLSELVASDDPTLVAIRAALSKARGEAG